MNINAFIFIEKISLVILAIPHHIFDEISTRIAVRSPGSIIRACNDVKLAWQYVETSVVNIASFQLRSFDDVMSIKLLTVCKISNELHQRLEVVVDQMIQLNHNNLSITMIDKLGSCIHFLQSECVILTNLRSCNGSTNYDRHRKRITSNSQLILLTNHQIKSVIRFFQCVWMHSYTLKKSLVISLC